MYVSDKCTKVFAGTAAPDKACLFQQPRQLASKTPRPGTALSRLSKLAKLSPGISPHQAALQLPRQTAAQLVVSFPADIARASAEDHPQGHDVVSDSGSISEPMLAAETTADQVGRVNDTDHLSQQAQHQQDAAGALADGAVEGAAACIAGTGHAQDMSQAGRAMLLLQF